MKFLFLELKPSPNFPEFCEEGLQTPQLVVRELRYGVSTHQGAKSSLLAKKDTSYISTATQAELPKSCLAIQVSGCRDGLSLALDCTRDRICIRYDQVGKFLSLVAELGMLKWDA